MKKGLLSVFFLLTSLFLMTACTKSEQAVEVYSFSGENDEIRINNGLIIVTEDLERFIGGDLSFKGEEPSDVKAYAEKFFFEKEGIEEGGLTNSSTIEGKTEGTEIDSELGAISSEDLFYGDDLEWIKESLKFSLTGKFMNGEKFDYKLDLLVEKAY